MEQWMDRNISIYKDIYKNNCDKEIAISHCTLSMVKILNGLSEMNHTEFYKYEKKMLWNAMELFSAQCIERIYYALALNCAETGNVERKKRVISDIENSISQMTEVCKNIFDTTANAERQMFQSLSIDTNMYELSPKLCAFYSSMLEKVVALFTEGKREYAFVMHPTLRSTIEARLLLETREESGKVVIIYISESVIEKFNLVPVCLMHEAFHVITKQERHRKSRAINFLENMSECMEHFLFSDVVFSEDLESDSHTKEELMNFWFGDVRKLVQEWKQEPEGSKRFYSKNLVKDVTDKIRKCLAVISANLEKTIFQFACEEAIKKDYASFKGEIERISGITDQIRVNLNNIILSNKVSEAASLLIFLYRETYADIACLLMLELDAGQYASAFADSIQFDYDRANYRDINREVREHLVAKIMSDFLPEGSKWKERLAEIEGQVIWHPGPSDETEKSGKQGRQSSKKHDRIMAEIMSVKMLQRFWKYLDECAEDFHIRLCGLSGIQEFRNSMKNVITGDTDQLLIDILSGNVSL